MSHPVDGSFNPLARAIITEAGLGRCIGCGRLDVTCQHRRPRGMGGTSDVSIGHPANGVPLCGSGTTGCHGWAERYPGAAMLLGWRLEHGQAALDAPWWSRTWGWRRWHQGEDGFIDHVYVDDDEDLDRQVERAAAVARFTSWRYPATSTGGSLSTRPAS